MSMTESEIMAHLARIVKTVEEAIAVAGEDGIPTGHLYAMLMPFGFTLQAFENVIMALVSAGRIEKNGNTVRAVRTLKSCFATED